jgi:hypothetical protein
MKLRQYARRILREWPPVWTGMGRDRKLLRGEVGVLTDAYSNNQAESAIFVVIRFRAEKFIGALLFTDCSCRTRILSLLQANAGRSIREIGDLEV